MDNLRLRFPQRNIPDLVLSQGVHAIGLDEEGQPALAGDAETAAVQFCVDRRGVWLQVCDHGGGLHVNGRPIRRMAMLRGGDSVFLEGVEMLLLGAEPRPIPRENPPAGHPDGRTVLRGVGGRYHGQCFGLRERLTVGRSADCGIRVDDMDLADRHAQLEPHAEGALLRDLGTGEGSVVNGHRVRDALLCAGDQVVFAPNQRFIVEAPTRGVSNPAVAVSLDDEGLAHEEQETQSRAAIQSSVRRFPWLLLAALLLAGALSLLLLYGSR